MQHICIWAWNNLGSFVVVPREAVTFSPSSSSSSYLVFRANAKCDKDKCRRLSVCGKPCYLAKRFLYSLANCVRGSSGSGKMNSGGFNEPRCSEPFWQGGIFPVRLVFRVAAFIRLVLMCHSIIRAHLLSFMSCFGWRLCFMKMGKIILSIRYTSVSIMLGDSLH